MLRPGFALVLLTALAAPAGAANKPNPDPKSLAIPAGELSKARDLVQRLGSDTFADREDAERDLVAMGRLARPALLDGVSRDPDPEVRARCRALLPRADAQEIAARLAAFTADVEGKYEHDLPGWHKLRAVVRGEFTLLGTTAVARPEADKAARALFVEFLAAPGGRRLMTALDGPPAELGQLIAARKTELYSARFPRTGGVGRVPAASEVAVVAFAESQVNSRHVPRATSLGNVITTSGLTAAVQGSDDGAAALRSVMGAWLDTRADALDLYSALTVANNMKLDEPAGRLAARMLVTPGLQGYYKGLALNTLMRLKPADCLPTVEQAFTDSAALSTTIRFVNGVQVRESIEVRDAALAAALVLTGQNPRDYGFDSFPASGVIGGTPTPGPTYSWARISDDKRKEAFDKWKAWREKNP